MACACASSRAQSTTSCRAAAFTASAVPQAPAPNTAIFMDASGGGDDLGLFARAGVLELRVLGFVHGLEVQLGEVHGREASARDDVGHVGAQVGVQDLRAGDAQDGADLLLRHVANLEDAGLLDLDEEHRLVLELGR